jgi:uncharacterized membrane protein YbhN (UPF0104 family)
MFTVVLGLLFVTVGAVILSLAQAWAMSSTSSQLSRHVLAWTASALILVLPVFLLLGFPYGIDAAHHNVAWSAIGLSGLTTGAAFALARRRDPAAAAQGFDLPENAWRLFPMHMGVLIVLGPVDALILGRMFLGNIH